MDSEKKRVGRPRAKSPSEKVLQRRRQRSAKRKGEQKPRGRPKKEPTQKQSQSQNINIKIGDTSKPKTKRRASKPRQELPPASIPQPTIIQQPAQPAIDYTSLFQALQNNRPIAPPKESVPEGVTNPLAQGVSNALQQSSDVPVEPRRAGKTAGTFVPKTFSNPSFTLSAVDENVPIDETEKKAVARDNIEGKTIFDKPMPLTGTSSEPIMSKQPEVQQLTRNEIIEKIKQQKAEEEASPASGGGTPRFSPRVQEAMDYLDKLPEKFVFTTQSTGVLDKKDPRAEKLEPQPTFRLHGFPQEDDVPLSQQSEAELITTKYVVPTELKRQADEYYKPKTAEDITRREELEPLSSGRTFESVSKQLTTDEPRQTKVETPLSPQPAMFLIGKPPANGTSYSDEEFKTLTTEQKALLYNKLGLPKNSKVAYMAEVKRRKEAKTQTQMPDFALIPEGQMTPSFV